MEVNSLTHVALTRKELNKVTKKTNLQNLFTIAPQRIIRFGIPRNHIYRQAVRFP